MSDTTTDTENNTENNTEADTDETAAPTGPNIGFAQQYVKDLSFESPQSPKIFMSQLSQPDVNVDFNVAAEPVENNIHEVVLNIEVKATLNDETMFIAELSYAGLVQVTNAADDVLKQILMIEAPRHLFPFARAILAETIRDGGFPPLLLNPIDFQGYFRHTQQNT